MKRILLLMLGVLLTLSAIARDFTYQGLTYTVISEEDKTCQTKAGENIWPSPTVSGNTVSGDLVIPSEVTDGETTYTVVAIGDYGFYECRSLTSISIPEGVTSIGKSAFNCCSSLTSINIPEGVTSIEKDAFGYCTGLTSVYYGADTPISGDAKIFSSETYEKATLYMTEAGVALTREIDPWKNFKNIAAYNFSGIEGITADFNADESYEVFNLNGVKVGDNLEGLTPGLYLMRQGQSASKILVK